MKRLLLIILPLLLCAPLPPAEACVGKTLLIASNGTPQQEVLAHLLATLIGERTGTTVKVVRFASQTAVHENLLKADLDIAVEYAAQARSEVLKQPPLDDAAALYQSVREAYNQELNLVWLAPFGFADAKLGQGAPVVRKDTLKKFPALARLIDKLGNRIDAATLQKLQTQAQDKPAADVARAFLKEQKLI
jgi:osmoprotectant transport system substrate-binding protein